VPGQVSFRIFGRQHVDGSVLEGMVAAGFEDERKV
jgi:hypothetical protein